MEGSLILLLRSKKKRRLQTTGVCGLTLSTPTILPHFTLSNSQTQTILPHFTLLNSQTQTILPDFTLSNSQTQTILSSITLHPNN